jgi:uncharacterized membrane protein YfcA
MPKKSTPAPLVSLRTLVILITASCCGALVGTLTFLSTARPAAALLAGLCTTGTAIAFLHRTLEN